MSTAPASFPAPPPTYASTATYPPTPAASAPPSLAYVPPPPPPPYVDPYVGSPAYASKMQSVKLLGGLGSLLLLLAFVPNAGGLFLPGMIMVMFALKRVSEMTGDKAIFDNALYAIVAAVVGIVVGVVLVFSALLAIFGVGGLRTIDWPGFTPTNDQLLGLALSAVLGLLAIWVSFIASAVYVKRVASGLTSRLGIRRFETAGTLYLVGAALTVILVGFIIMAVAALMFALAFFAIEDVPAAWPPAPRVVA